MIKRSIFLTLLLNATGGSLLAATTYVPENAKEISNSASSGRYELPAGPISNGVIPIKQFNGNALNQAWKINASQTGAILDALINQYERDGFKLSFRCLNDACGGFDFRYTIETPSPRQFIVNLDTYEYAQMRSDEEVVSILASVDGGAVYLQQLNIKLSEAKEVVLIKTASEVSAESGGREILKSLKFKSGSAELDSFDPDELKKLALRLQENPTETLYLVGHSDQQGGLELNLGLSKRRAQSVVDKLQSDYGVARGRVIAQGVAFLAPIATNATPEGREINRRVEAVFLVN